MNASLLARLSCIGMFSTLCLVGADELLLNVAPDGSQLVVKRGEKPVLTYLCARSQFKPYVRDLHAANGVNVLLDAPADHLHHHGLMYAVRVNGVNFWEETGEPGHEIPVALLSHASGRVGAFPARFTQLIHWVAHTNARASDTKAVALLIERRTLSVSVDGDEVAVDWTGEFQVGLVPVQVHGSGYNGLGLRVPPPFNGVAERRNSEQMPYSTAATWDVAPGRWSAMSGKAEGRETTIVIFSSPENAGDEHFFSMLNPFSYLAATQNLDKKPLNYGPGEHFSVRYLVAVYPGRTPSDLIHQRYARWQKSIETKPGETPP